MAAFSNTPATRTPVMCLVSLERPTESDPCLQPTQLLLQPEALTQLSTALRSAPPPLRVVAVAGPAGDGKSTLCNALHACWSSTLYAPLFASSDSLLSGTTAGVWAAVAVGSADEGSLLVLDFEGSDMGNASACAPK